MSDSPDDAADPRADKPLGAPQGGQGGEPEGEPEEELDATLGIDRTVSYRELTGQEESEPELPDIPSVEIRREIGRGGMGVVYEARQTFLERDVAVKVLRESAPSSEFNLRFQREAKLLALLSHPNIVSCYHAGALKSGQCFLVMEYIDGPNLLDQVKDSGALVPKAAVSLCRDLARALGYAYSKKLIHRDIKPANVLLQPQAEGTSEEFPFRTKLADLGLARPESSGTADMGLTVPGAVLGSPATMAPEQFNAPESVDYRADIYGLGCVLFYALAGETAFPQGTLAELVTRKLSGECPDLNKSCHGSLPKPLADLVKDMLASDREKRPQSYAEIVERCDKLLAQSQESQSKPASSFPILPVAVGGLILAAAGAWGIFSMLGDKAPPADDEFQEQDITDSTDVDVEPPPAKSWAVLLEESTEVDAPAQMRVGDELQVRFQNEQALAIKIENSVGEELWNQDVAAGQHALPLTIKPRTPPQARFSESFTLTASEPGATESESSDVTFELCSFDVVDPESALAEYRSRLLTDSIDLATVPARFIQQEKFKLAELHREVEADALLSPSDIETLFADPDVLAREKALARRSRDLPRPMLQLSLPDPESQTAVLVPSQSPPGQSGQPTRIYSSLTAQKVVVRIQGPWSSRLSISRDGQNLEPRELSFTDEDLGELTLDLELEPGHAQQLWTLRDSVAEEDFSFLFVLDKEAPVIFQPTDKRQQGQVASLQIKVQDKGAGVSNVNWRASDDTGGASAMNSTSNETWTADVPLALGLNSFEVYASDRVHNDSIPLRFAITRLPSAPPTGIDTIMSVLLADDVFQGVNFPVQLDGPIFPKKWDIPPRWEFYSTGISDEDPDALYLLTKAYEIRLIALRNELEPGPGRVAAVTEVPLDEPWTLRGALGMAGSYSLPSKGSGESLSGRIAFGTLDGTMVVFELHIQEAGGNRSIERTVSTWNAVTMMAGAAEIPSLELETLALNADQRLPSGKEGVEFSIQLEQDSVQLGWGPTGSLLGQEEPQSGVRFESFTRAELGWKAGAEGTLILQSEAGSFTFQGLELKLKK